MSVLSAAAFERRLKSLTSTEFAEFVADIWAARGADVTVEGPFVTVTTSDHGPRRLRTVYRDTRLPIDLGPVPSRTGLEVVDVLVTNVESDRLRDIAVETDTRYIGPNHLRSMALYAIDREQSAAIFETYFRLSIEGKQSREVPTERIEWMVETISPEDYQLTYFSSRSPGIGSVEIPLAGIVTAVLVLTLIVLPIASLHGKSTPFSDPHRTVPSSEFNQTDTNAAQRFPPGHQPSKLTNRSDLVAVHEQSLANRPYILTLTHTGTRGRLLTTGRLYRVKQRVSVSAGGGIRYTVNGSFPPVTVGTSPVSFSGRIVANGTNCVTHVSGDSRIKPNLETVCQQVRSKGNPPFPHVTSAYINRYLTQSGSHVHQVTRDNQSMYRIVETTPPEVFPINVADYRVIAIVSESGLVRWFSVSYRHQNGDGRRIKRFSFRVRTANSTS